MWASTTPAAIDAFVAKLVASPDLADVGLRDGPTVVRDARQEVITVGFVDENDDTAVDGALDAEGLVSEPSRERYSVRCAAWVQRGNGDIADARRRVYQLLSVVGAVLAVDMTLGGLVLSARLGQVTYTPLQTKGQGGVARLVFTVDVDAYTAE